MPMYTIAFFLSHTSHQNSTFPLTKLLVHAKVNVVFCGFRKNNDGDGLQKNVLSKGYEYVVLPDSRKKTDERSKFLKFYESLENGKLFRKFIKRYKPDLLIVDIHLPLFAIGLNVFGIPIISISTELPTTFCPDVPPLHSQLPIEKGNNRELIAREWRLVKAHQISAPALEVVRSLAVINRMPLSRIDINRCIVPFGIHGPHLVMWPACVDARRPKKFLKSIYYFDCSIAEQIVDTPKSGSTQEQLIYCFMGGRYNQYCESRFEFLGKILKVADLMVDWKFLISTSLNHFEVAYPLPFNVAFVKYISQPDVLKKAELMINHGGGNSVKECIAYGIPQYCFPYEADQFGNSQRILKNKIGKVGSIFDSSSEIAKNVEEILQNKAVFIKRIKRLQKRILKLYDPLYEVRKVESFIKNSFEIK